MHSKITHSKPLLGKEEVNAVKKVILSSNIGQGQKVEEFENAMARYIGRKYAIAVSSGTAALHLSLLALNIKKGDEVVLPSYVCDALLNAVLYVGAKPVITDVDYETRNITFKEIKKAISKKTKAIIVPHMFGYPAEMNFKTLIPVIEDCAVSLGAKVGTFGKISVFSFSATKMIATGEGGMILTDDKKIADLVRELRDYTHHKEYRVRYNYKMNDIQAAIGIVQLKKLNTFIKKRKYLVSLYNKLLKKNYKGLYRYAINVDNPELVRRKMLKKGIVCGKGVLRPLHQLLKLSSKKYPNSERLSKEIVSLPLYPSLTLKDVLYICKSFKEAI